MRHYTVTYSPCETDETPFSYEEDAFIGWVDEIFCEGYKRDEDDMEGRPQTAQVDIIEDQDYVVEVNEPTCLHDHGHGWFQRELSHMRDHWFSCLLGCILVHLAMDGAILWELFSLR